MKLEGKKRVVGKFFPIVITFAEWFLFSLFRNRKKTFRMNIASKWYDYKMLKLFVCFLLPKVFAVCSWFHFFNARSISIFIRFFLFRELINFNFFKRKKNHTCNELKLKWKKNFPNLITMNDKKKGNKELEIVFGHDIDWSIDQIENFTNYLFCWLKCWAMFSFRTYNVNQSNDYHHHHRKLLIDFVWIVKCWLLNSFQWIDHNDDEKDEKSYEE